MKTTIIIIMIKLLTKLTKLTKVVFGKNSDRPEGEVQEVVEVGCFLQLVYFVFVCFGIGLFIITQYVRSRPQTILLVLVSRFFQYFWQIYFSLIKSISNVFGKNIILLSAPTSMWTRYVLKET